MTDPDDTIRRLAYALWEARGRPPNCSEVDWLAAEREVKGRRDAASHTQDATKLEDGLGLITPPPEDLKEDGVTNPTDGRGPLRNSDDQSEGAMRLRTELPER